jgi:hypothetical protein
MKNFAKVLPVLGFFLLMGCLPPPAPQPIPANPDYGPPPPANYRQLIKADLGDAFWTNVIVGSKPVEYAYYEPRKAYVEANHELGMNQTFGWVVCGTTTRRELYSGYSRYDGPIPFYVLFKNGKVAYHLIGQTTYDHSTEHMLNNDIKKVCTRPAP